MASLELTGFSCTLSALLTVLLLPSHSSGQTNLTSHYETYTYQVAIRQTRCYTNNYTYCYNWWYWNYWNLGWYWYPDYYYGYYWNPWYGFGRWSWCNSYSQTSCNYDYTYETRTAQRCQAGWVGSLCDVPTCTPACSSGRVCVDLNRCGCAQDGSTTANCQLLPCSPTNNCYPGTCVNGQCKCPPGFSGTNCLNFVYQPQITSCSVSLFARPTSDSPEIQVAQADCSAPGSTPQVTWINGPNLNKASSDLGISRIEPVWTASYTYPTPMPGRPEGASTFFVLNTPVNMGISDAGFNISFSGFTTSKLQCSYPDLATTLPSTATCDIPTTWNDLSVNPLIGHDITMVVSMYAVLGAAKTGDSTYSYGGYNYDFGIQQFEGIPVVTQSMLKFDLGPPTHCLLEQAGSILPGNGRINCTVYPIYLDQDIRTNPVIRPLFLGWTDDGSGIRTFHVEVFSMQPDVTGEQLEPDGLPLPDSVTDISPQLNNYQFTVPAPGVYSIVVTVYDFANNSATARKIFTYMNQPSYSTTSAAVFIQESNPATNYSFITSLTNPNQLNLVWNGKFQANRLYQAVLSKRVRPLPLTQSTIDDIFGTQFGQRSINVVDNQTGISSLNVLYLVDSENGGFNALPTAINKTRTAQINEETATLVFDTPLRLGDTVVVWLIAVGSAGNQATYQLNVGIDTTRPISSESMFVKNGASRNTSRVTLRIFDEESGINATRFNILDLVTNTLVVLDTVVKPDTRLPPNRQKRETTGVQTCSASDVTCYCTPYQQCFPYLQTIDIDNCKLTRLTRTNMFTGLDETNLLFQYWISNKAGLEVSGSLQLNDLSGLSCVPSSLSGITYRSSGPTAIIGIAISCVIGFIWTA